MSEIHMCIYALLMFLIPVLQGDPGTPGDPGDPGLPGRKVRHL